VNAFEPQEGRTAQFSLDMVICVWITDANIERKRCYPVEKVHRPLTKQRVMESDAQLSLQFADAHLVFSGDDSSATRTLLVKYFFHRWEALARLILLATNRPASSMQETVLL
jgi:hypothetical protein